MSIPYPWEVDWAYAATDIVMPALIWLYVVAVVLILLDAAVKSARRAEDQWLREISATEAPPTAETSEAITHIIKTANVASRTRCDRLTAYLNEGTHER